MSGRGQARRPDSRQWNAPAGRTLPARRGALIVAATLFRACQAMPASAILLSILGLLPFIGCGLAALGPNPRQPAAC